MKLVLASRNPGKIVEFNRLLAGYDVTVVGLDDVGFEGDIEETGADYRENAVLKAETVAAHTGLAAVADDSGIEVAGLGGWPGFHSARWLGPGRTDAERLEALLERLERDGNGDRRARYVAVLALAIPGRPTVTAEGRTTGTLVAPRGAGGFGYDPAFLSDDLGVTFAEASAADKDRVSHRGRALRELARLGMPERGVEAPGV